MNLKVKLNLVLVSIVVVSTSAIIFFSYSKSKSELTAAVLKDNLDIAQKTASDMNLLVESDFRMLETMAKFPSIADPDGDLHEKWELTNAVTAGNPRYNGTGFFDPTGNGYNSSGQFVDMHTREYIVSSMAGRRGCMDPHYSSYGKFVLTYSAPVKSPAGSLVGIVTAVIDAVDMAQTMERIVIGKGSHPFIVNARTGKIVAHHDQNVMKGEKTFADITSEDLRKAVPEVMSGGTASVIYYDGDLKMKMSAAHCPISGTEWEVVLVAPYSDFFSGIESLFRVMLAIGGCALAVAAVVGVRVVNAVVNPLKDVSSAINSIASGDADLTRRLKASSKDEIGEVVGGFNTFSAKLQTIIGGIKGTSGHLVAAGSRMAEIADSTAMAIDGITENINSMHEKIEEQTGSVSQTAGAVNEIASNIESLERMISGQSDSVSQASAAVEQMIGNISSVNSTVDKMANSFDKLRSRSQDGFTKQQSVNEKVKEIEGQSKMLQEANSAISAIASQTNLLAMNAAIEAAHAGESGKGFAVVADEIRKLSETSNMQSKTIGDQLKNIRNSIKTVVDSSNEASATFSEVSGMLDETDALVMQIKGAMSEQNEGSSQITEALGHMNSSTAEVRAASEEMRQGNEMILAEVKRLQDATAAMKGSMGEMADSAQKISGSGAVLEDVAGTVKDAISDIGAQVDKFKV